MSPPPAASADGLTCACIAPCGRTTNSPTSRASSCTTDAAQQLPTTRTPPRTPDPAFGRWQNAESILFYAGCLALLGRSKIFNDDGHQFVDGLTTSGAKLGRGWANIFAADGLAPPEGEDVGEQTARCKKSYPWNLLGDCTLPLHAET